MSSPPPVPPLTAQPTTSELARAAQHYEAFEGLVADLRLVTERLQ